MCAPLDSPVLPATNMHTQGRTRTPDTTSIPHTDAAQTYACTPAQSRRHMCKHARARAPVHAEHMRHPATRVPVCPAPPGAPRAPVCPGQKPAATRRHGLRRRGAPKASPHSGTPALREGGWPRTPGLDTQRPAQGRPGGGRPDRRLDSQPGGCGGLMARPDTRAPPYPSGEAGAGLPRQRPAAA